MKNKLAHSIKKVVFVTLLILLLLFSNGRFTLFFAIWISTPMLLYVARSFSVKKGFLIVWLLSTIASLIQFYTIVPLPIPFFIITMMVFGLVTTLPYWIDRLLLKNKDSFLHTLVFPVSWVLLQYIFLRFHPYGTWGHIDYTQQSQLVLLQSVAVFGLGYLTFLIGWFASVCNWLLAQKFQWKHIKRGVLIYSLVFGLTIAYGGYRLLVLKPTSKTIRIASISALEGLGIYDNNVFGLTEKGAETKNKEYFQKRTSELNKSLLERSVREAKAGAKIVFWAEGNSYILKDDEQAFYKQVSSIAMVNNIYLGMGLAVVDETNNKPIENKFVLFNSEGKRVIDYWKVIPVPGAEAANANIKGDKIQKTTTPYGTIAAAICFDMDFPWYLKQAKGADIFLAPSNDWKAIDPVHTNMVRFRAIEQGFNLIRQTSNGLSAGIDYTGKVISEMDHFTSNDKVLITQLPTKGVTTIYAIIGDAFIYFSLLLFIAMLIVYRKRQTK